MANQSIDNRERYTVIELGAVVVGGLITIVVTIVVEWVRKPKLDIEIGDPADNNYPSGQIQQGRFIYLHVHNKPLSFFRWMARNPALQCHGTITFHDMEGQRIFDRAMPIRWSDSPEPIAPQVVVNNTAVTLIDPHRIGDIERRDIHPGESERMDIVARFENDTECYGWSNQNYFSTPAWRNPDWCLPRGKYLACVNVVSSGEKCTRVFRVINTGQRKDLHVEHPQPNDKVH